jgi:hypothetical protein
VRRFLWWVFFSAFFCSPLFSAFEEKPSSARSAALAESSVGSSEGFDASRDNPGALDFAERSGISLGHTALFGDSDWPHNSLSGVVKTQRGGSVGFFLTDFGSSLYREREIGLSWGGRLGDRAGLGATLKRQDLEIERYGRLSAHQVDLGLFGRPLPVLGAGVAVKNITQSTLGGTPEGAPALLSAGISVTALAQGPTSLAVVSPSDGQVSWRVGQEAWLHPVFALRGGVESAPTRFTLGLGVRHSFFSLDYAFLTHPLLPDQHVFNVNFPFGSHDRDGEGRFLRTKK